MIKLKSPIGLTLIASGCIFAIVQFTEQGPAAAPSKPKTATTTTKTSDGVQLAKVRFARYGSRQRDIFKPGITQDDGSGDSGDSSDSWSLTGISSVNGVQSALVENSSTKETRFLKTGSVWDGKTVLAIESTEIVLRDQQGHTSRLGFAEPPEINTAPSPAMATASGTGAQLTVQPLSPATINVGSISRRARRSAQ